MKSEELIKRLDGYHFSDKVRNVLSVLITEMLDDFIARKHGKLLQQIALSLGQVYKDDAKEIVRFLTDKEPRAVESDSVHKEFKKHKDEDGCLGCEQAKILEASGKLNSIKEPVELQRYIEDNHGNDARDVLFELCKAVGKKPHHKNSIESLAQLYVK